MLIWKTAFYTLQKSHRSPMHTCRSFRTVLKGSIVDNTDTGRNKSSATWGKSEMMTVGHENDRYIGFM